MLRGSGQKWRLCAEYMCMYMCRVGSTAARRGGAAAVARPARPARTIPRQIGGLEAALLRAARSRRPASGVRACPRLGQGPTGRKRGFYFVCASFCFDLVWPRAVGAMGGGSVAGGLLGLLRFGATPSRRSEAAGTGLRRLRCAFVDFPESDPDDGRGIEGRKRVAYSRPKTRRRSASAAAALAALVW